MTDVLPPGYRRVKRGLWDERGWGPDYILRAGAVGLWIALSLAYVLAGVSLWFTLTTPWLEDRRDLFVIEEHHTEHPGGCRPFC